MELSFLPLVLAFLFSELEKSPGGERKNQKWKIKPKWKNGNNRMENGRREKLRNGNPKRETFQKVLEPNPRAKPKPKRKIKSKKEKRKQPTKKFQVKKMKILIEMY